MNEFGIYRRTKTNCSHLFRHVDFGHLLRHLLFFLFLRTNIAKTGRKLYSQMLPKSSYRLTQIESSLFSVYIINIDIQVPLLHFYFFYTTPFSIIGFRTNFNIRSYSYIIIFPFCQSGYGYCFFILSYSIHLIITEVFL